MCVSTHGCVYVHVCAGECGDLRPVLDVFFSTCHLIVLDGVSFWTQSLPVGQIVCPGYPRDSTTSSLLSSHWKHLVCAAATQAREGKGSASLPHFLCRFRVSWYDIIEEGNMSSHTEGGPVGVTASRTKYSYSGNLTSS